MSTRESTRTRLLDATDQVLFADGAVHAPVDVILERAGVSPATLYRAYASKDELVAAALERRHERWLQVWDAAVDAATDDAGRLLAVLDALDRFRREPTGARWCAFLGTAAGHPEPPDVMAAVLREESAVMRGRLRELAVPLVGECGADELADRLVLVVSGDLAVRLRPGPARHGAARDVATLVVDRAVAGA